ncbi:MAG: hypothetical protein ACC656_07115 [Candidatus Heimdallarchaeota archaeon]
MKFSKKLYILERGIGANDKAYKVSTISGNLKSFKFVALLKSIIEKEIGSVGGSLNSIITGIAGTIGFHHKDDYKYYMKKAKKLYYEKYF